MIEAEIGREIVHFPGSLLASEGSSCHGQPKFSQDRRQA
jgi:hypothetical protein